MQVVDARQDASVFVVADATRPGERVRLFACLVGGQVCDASLFMWPTGHTPCGLHLKYGCSTQVRRIFRLTDAFRARHPEIAGNIEAACNWPKSKWRLARADDHADGVWQLCTGRGRGRQVNKAQFFKLVAKLQVGESGWQRQSAAA